MKNRFNKLIEMGLREFMTESCENLAQEDERYLTDISDSYDLKERYEELGLQRNQKIVIDDYIGCIKATDERYSQISYIAGVKDTVEIFVQLGLLKD